MDHNFFINVSTFQQCTILKLVCIRQLSQNFMSNDPPPISISSCVPTSSLLFSGYLIRQNEINALFPLSRRTQFGDWTVGKVFYFSQKMHLYMQYQPCPLLNIFCSLLDLPNKIAITSLKIVQFTVQKKFCNLQNI